jgi:mannose-1-phosphate guanylyltransferase
MRHHQPKTAMLLSGLPPFGARQFERRLAEVYPLCENISIDYAIAEKAARVTGIAMDDIGWNDVGSWEAVYGLASKDQDGNASRGELIVQESRGNFVDAAKTVALVGVENLIVVETRDALLVASRNNAQDVSKLVKALEEKGREELL